MWKLYHLEGAVFPYCQFKLSFFSWKWTLVWNSWPRISYPISKSFWKSNLVYKYFEDSLFVRLLRCLEDTEETWQNIELYLCVLFSSGNVIGILFTRHTKSVQSRGTTASFPCHINPKRNRIENKIQSMIALQEKSIIQSWLLNLTTTFLYWSHLLFSAFQ